MIFLPMFANEKKELEKTTDNVKITINRKIEPITDFSIFNEVLAHNIKTKFDTFNVIQQYTIPVVLGGSDFICKAPTGSGKTLCYIIPIIYKIIKNPGMKACIICPVRELCDQIKRVCQELSKKVYVSKKHEKNDFYFDFKRKKDTVTVATVYGQKRDDEDVNKANILIATPGKLIDNLKKNNINFDNLEVMIFDEADRLYDCTFKQQIDEIKKFIHTNIQTCMFSATYPKEIINIFDMIVKKERICLEADYECKTKVKQEIFMVKNKFEKILEIFKGINLVNNWREHVEAEKVIIFVERKLDCIKLTKDLEKCKYKCISLHGDKTQFERNESLKKFRTGLCSVLIATSVAARGLDIKDLKMVINYDLPGSIDEYVHRIGRTGRAGEEGKAISFYDNNVNCNFVRNLVKILKDNQQEVPNFLLQNNKKFDKHVTHSASKIKPKEPEPLETSLSELNIAAEKTDTSDEELNAW